MPGLVPRARARGVLPALLALPLAAALALPATAAAGSLGKKDRNAVSKKVAQRFDLTRKERRALDIARVRVIGKEDLGVMVDVRFKGNVEKRIGRGHLKRAAIALVLEPRPKRGKAAVIVTQGAPRSQRIRRRTRSKNAGAIRTGRSAKFFIQGDGFSKVKAVRVLALARAPRAARRALASQQDDGIEEMTDGEVEVITTRAIVADALFAALIASRIDTDELECDELADLGDRLEAAIRRAEDYFDLLTDAEQEIEQALEQAESDEERAALEDALREVRATRALVVISAAVLTTFLERVDAILDEECGPPPNGGPTLGAYMIWQLFGPFEVAAREAYFRRIEVTAAQSASPIGAIKIVVPPDGSTARQVTNFLCPAQLPAGTIQTTSAPNDTLVCSGGSLQIEERFDVNVRTSPAPTQGMGGQLFGQQDGQFRGPFAISGP